MTMIRVFASTNVICRKGTLSQVVVLLFPWYEGREGGKRTRAVHKRAKLFVVILRTFESSLDTNNSQRSNTPTELEDAKDYHIEELFSATNPIESFFILVVDRQSQGSTTSLVMQGYWTLHYVYWLMTVNWKKKSF